MFIEGGQSHRVYLMCLSDAKSHVAPLLKVLDVVLYGFEQIHTATIQWFAVQPEVSRFDKRCRQPLSLIHAPYL